ncbi:protein cueball isoform X1 [Cydia fagiglandana]|uniref:protein cueball isoform X1 n=1 Tax=Cydia fagiglandana TaxID=1458189 RepID=UPI002FEE1D99
MCNALCFALFALSVNLVKSWDIAVTSGDQLEFYTGSNKTGSESGRLRDLTALAYDAVHNMLLFVDKQNDNASIFSYNLATKKYQPLVRKGPTENIQGLAFDPVQSLLFWTDFQKRSIYWIDLKPGSKNSDYGNLLINLGDQLPRAIAVDSCRGYIYWTNTNVASGASIERARFDGSERKTIISTNIHLPTSIFVDQQTQRLYWADDKEGIHYSIESSDLDGTPESRQTLHSGTEHQPNALTVSNDSLYWVDWGFRKVWKLPKNARQNAEPEDLIDFKTTPFGIVANYLISDQAAGIPECNNLLRLSQNTSAIDNSFAVPQDAGLFCLHGRKIEGQDACTCSPGYIGDRCETSVCQNFCLKGECTFDANNGEPTCRCQKGFTGARCEVDMCEGFCLNNGICSVETNSPVCTCIGDHTGHRCEKTVEAPRVVTVNEPCNCTKDKTTKLSALEVSDEFVTVPCNDGWDSVRDPILMVLGILCGLLCLVCAVLVTKILHLKKRPRIKKRIIVNKNVTPLTARPDQCEITIENCCNMNICETPCFEPRSTIRPTLLDAKPGKEEKRNLIANMEHPDDF